MAKAMQELTTEEDFRAYEEVRRGGRYNMFTQARAAADAANLDWETYQGVFKNYKSLMEKYPDVRK